MIQLQTLCHFLRLVANLSPFRLVFHLIDVNHVTESPSLVLLRFLPLLNLIQSCARTFD